MFNIYYTIYITFLCIMILEFFDEQTRNTKDKSTEIRLCLPFSYQFRTKQIPVWFQSNNENQ